jgi:hypothetical protein
MKRFVYLVLLLTTACKPTADEKAIELTALDLGNQISIQAQQTLGKQLTLAMAEGGPVHAVSFCNTAAYPILDTLQTIVPTSIKRASLNVRNPGDAPTEMEQRVLETFTLEIEASIENPGPRIIALPDNRLIYLKPIILNNPICLNCHGKAGTEISDETYALIRQLYPNDNAINHRMGDLRGAWSITFNKADIIEYLKENSQE